MGSNALCTAVLGGTVYATDFEGNLYTVNMMTGAASLIGYTGIPSVPAYQKILGSNLGDDESFFGISGKLYATFDVYNTSTSKPVFGPELYQINPTTGLATIVGSTTLYIDAAAEVDGSVYAFTAADQLLSLDLARRAKRPLLGITTRLHFLSPARPPLLSQFRSGWPAWGWLRFLFSVGENCAPPTERLRICGAGWHPAHRSVIGARRGAVRLANS